MKKNTTRKTYFGLRFIATGEDTNGKYFLSQTTVPAGDQGPPIHTHSYEDEGFYLVKGKLIFEVNGKEIELKEGEFLNVQKGESHTWRNNTSQDAELIVNFVPAGIENMFIELDSSMDQIGQIGLKYGTKFYI